MEQHRRFIRHVLNNPMENVRVRVTRQHDLGEQPCGCHSLGCSGEECRGVRWLLGQ